MKNPGTIYVDPNCRVMNLDPDTLAKFGLTLEPTDNEFFLLTYEDEDKLDELLIDLYPEDDEEGSFIGTCKYFHCLTEPIYEK